MTLTWVEILPDNSNLPPKRGRVLAYDKPTDRLFIASYDDCGRGNDIMWSDEECTYVPVTHYALVELP